MSAKAIKTLAFAFAIIVISISGYYVGVSLQPKSNVPPSDTPPPANTTTEYTEHGQESQKPKPLKKSKFQAISPSYGPIVTTEAIEVTYGNDIATTVISDKIKEQIKVGQKVILLDQEDYVLPLGGEISEIQDHDVTISLPTGTNTELLNNRVFVMTNVFKNVKRIPLSAVTPITKNEATVWIATPTEEGFEVLPKTISITTSAQNEELIQVNHTISIDDLVIINPNKKISDDFRYTLDVIPFNAPIHDPIQQAWIDYELYRLEAQQRRHIRDANNCKRQVKPALEGDQSTETSATCGGDASPTDPMVIFENILSKMPPEVLDE